MWLSNLKELCIYKSRYVNIITRNTTEDLNDLSEIKEAKFALSHKECDSFIKIKSQAIETIKVQGDIKDEYLKVEYFQFKVKFLTNLNKIIYFQMAVTNEDLQVLGQNCSQLSSLHVIKCFCEDFQSLQPGININIDHLCHIKQLQEFKFEPEKPAGTVKQLKLKYLQHILKNCKKLTSLNLQNFTIVCQDHVETNRMFRADMIWQLEVLSLGIITFDFWCTFTGYLKGCPQLRELTIHANDSNIAINVKITDILSKCCKKLQVLCLKSCEINVEDFMPLQGLQEMSLISCIGLTFNNLQQILGGLKLRTFKLINTPVNDVNNYIYLAPTLQFITIDSINGSSISEIFQNSINNFESLHTLNWFKGDINHNWLRDKCPQLQQLHLPNPYLLPRFVCRLKCLKQLTFTSGNGLTWSILKLLVSKLTLTRFNIYADNVVIDDKRISEDSFREATTLEHIEIPFEIFLMGLKYWLDVLDVNEHLGFVIYGKAADILNVRLLCLLLAVDCVRRRWERIKICGFKLDLHNFQNNTVLREIVHLHINTNHYKTRKIPFTLEL